MRDKNKCSIEIPENVYSIWPPGHYYSPIPDLHQILAPGKKIFSQDGPIAGVDLNDDGQVDLLNKLSAYYSELPFSDEQTPDFRYYYHNFFYSYGDAILLFCMLRHLKPKRIVEIGSGFSSAVFLDVNEKFFNNQIKCTFIEPYPDRIMSLLRPDDLLHSTLIQKKLEDVDPSIFKELEENDILFIDSTHVSKIDSDVNHIFFDILPLLNKGVSVHIHDIFFPFEYPPEWLREGRFWNEAYLLRAFLQYNDTFKISLFSSYLYSKHAELVRDRMPLFEKCTGGCIWLKKVR